MTPDYDQIHMAQCIEMAKDRLGYVSPNPMVGSLIARNSEVLARGVHRTFGADHAEVAALKNLPTDCSREGLTLYVNLEPCCHFGKTPPCSEAIIKSGIKRVVVGCIDPFVKVSGGGIEQLRGSGIEVTLGVLEEESRELNRRFFTFHQKRRPYIVLKWAETADHYIARPDGSSRWISCWDSRKLTHQWRSEEDAIMVGTKTAVIDNPQLSVRHTTGTNPARLVIDKELKLSQDAHLLDQSVPTIVFNFVRDQTLNNLEYCKLDPTRPILPQVMARLFDREIQSLLVEGGAGTHRSFLEADLWDEIRAFRSKEEFKEGISAPHLPDPAPNVKITEQSVGTDLLTTITRKQSGLGQ